MYGMGLRFEDFADVPMDLARSCTEGDCADLYSLEGIEGGRDAPGRVEGGGWRKGGGGGKHFGEERCI